MNCTMSLANEWRRHLPLKTWRKKVCLKSGQGLKSIHPKVRSKTKHAYYLIQNVECNDVCVSRHALRIRACIGYFVHPGPDHRVFPLGHHSQPDYLYLQSGRLFWFCKTLSLAHNKQAGTSFSRHSTKTYAIYIYILLLLVSYININIIVYCSPLISQNGCSKFGVRFAEFVSYTMVTHQLSWVSRSSTSLSSIIFLEYPEGRLHPVTPTATSLLPSCFLIFACLLCRFLAGIARGPDSPVKTLNLPPCALIYTLQIHPS